MRLEDLLLREDGTYVAVKPVGGTVGLMAQWLARSGLPNLEPIEDLHVTILYSRKPVRVICTDEEFHATPAGWDLFKNDDGSRSLVLLLDSPGLHRRHQKLMALGATYDFPSYKPHLTVSYHFNEETVAEVPPVDFGLTFGKEYTEALRA